MRLTLVTNPIPGGEDEEERDKEMLHRPDRGGGQEGNKSPEEGQKDPQKVLSLQETRGRHVDCFDSRCEGAFFYAKIALVPVERRATKDWVFDYFLCWECAVLVGLRPKGPLLREKNARTKGQEFPGLLPAGPAPDFYS